MTTTDAKRNQETISLWIDSYSDIFSDFDPRPYTGRTISDDFINQLKRVSRESSGQFAVFKLLVPEGSHNEEHERAIRKRLENFFANIYAKTHTDVAKIRTKGVAFLVFGVMLMVAASYIASINYTGFTFKLLLTLFEPGGWFFFWTGLDLVTSILPNKKDEARFYERMKSVHVEFGTYK